MKMQIKASSRAYSIFRNLFVKHSNGSRELDLRFSLQDATTSLIFSKPFFASLFDTWNSISAWEEPVKYGLINLFSGVENVVSLFFATWTRTLLNSNNVLLMNCDSAIVHQSICYWGFRLQIFRTLLTMTSKRNLPKARVHHFDRWDQTWYKTFHFRWSHGWKYKNFHRWWKCLCKV